MKKMIFTSSYENGGNSAISISGDRGKGVGFNGKTMSELAPKKQFFEQWQANKDKLSSEENELFYIDHYYKEVLSKLNPGEVFENIDDKNVLVCYEKNTEFCHRHLVSFWFELFLDVETHEVKIKNGKISIVKRPEYLKEKLETVIKKYYDMKGFNCIESAYLFNVSEDIRKYIYGEIEQDRSKEREYDIVLAIADRMRETAFEKEKNYKNIK